MAQSKEKGGKKTKTLVKKESKLTTVYLVGSLGKIVGREKWELDVFSIPEALRAIDINTRGKLTAYLRGPGKDKGYRIALQNRKNFIDKEEVKIRSGRSTIYIMPTIAGKNSGAGKVIAGVVLIALAVVAQQYQLLPGILSATGGATSGALIGGTVGTIAAGFGVSLILGGVTQLLTPNAKGPTTENEDQKNSTSFQGNVAAVVQGGCVPVVYGRALVSPIPVSITVDNDDLSTTQAGDPDSIEETDLNGGGVQYTTSN